MCGKAIHLITDYALHHLFIRVSFVTRVQKKAPSQAVLTLTVCAATTILTSLVLPLVPIPFTFVSTSLLSCVRFYHLVGD